MIIIELTLKQMGPGVGEIVSGKNEIAARFPGRRFAKARTLESEGRRETAPALESEQLT
jgi:hypothetical protein